MRTFKCINYQQGKILVDEQAEIKEGDTYLSNGTVYRADTNTYQNKLPKWFGGKIIAQTPNLNLKGIPFIELEEDNYNEEGLPIVSKSEADFFNSKYRGKFANSDLNEAIKLLRDWDAYKAAQPKKYTEDDLRKAIEMAQQMTYGDSAEFPEHFYDADEIIQSLQPAMAKIESIEVETEIVPDLDSYSGGNGEIFTTNKKEQLITYQKDGRTYLKKNKINYEI